MRQGPGRERRRPLPTGGLGVDAGSGRRAAAALSDALRSLGGGDGDGEGAYCSSSTAGTAAGSLKAAAAASDCRGTRVAVATFLSIFACASALSGSLYVQLNILAEHCGVPLVRGCVWLGDVRVRTYTPDTYDRAGRGRGRTIPREGVMKGPATNAFFPRLVGVPS